jgi:hypothetical protein
MVEPVHQLESRSVYRIRHVKQWSVSIREDEFGYEADDPLPYLEWELTQERFRIPVDLQQVLRLPTALVRIGIDIDRKQRTKHVRTLDLYLQRQSLLMNWEYWREHPSHPSGTRWEVLQFVVAGNERHAVPVIVVLGTDRRGSLNLITIHRKNARWAQRFFRRELGFQKRGGE